MRPSDLHVICVLSNPVRYESRARLFREFLERMEHSGVTLWVVEAAFGERDYEVAEEGNPRHVRLRCDHELWIKEAMINAAAARLPLDARYVMWLDADVEFLNRNWAMETLHALQSFNVVQPFSHAVDLGPNQEALERHTGFAYRYRVEGARPGRKYQGHMHPGYCWAWRREAWDAVGGMIDFAICGAGDHHMACALAGAARVSVPVGLQPSYMRMILQWEERALEAVEKSIGYVPGALLHYFHGAKSDRRYEGRWEILKGHGFDPERDITRDSQGLPRLRGNKPAMRDALQTYFRQRNEDAR